MFNGHSIDDIGANLICKQLSILSNHPVQMFHITISDLVQWIGATQEDPLHFINNHIFKHPTSTRHLALIAENDDHVSIFSGNAKWLQSVFYKSNEHSRDETSYMQRCFETILLDKIMEACISCPSLAPHKRSSMTIDGDVHTISSCMKQCIEIALADWSKIELEIANRSLRELQEWSKRTEENTSKCNDFLSSCCTKLIEVSQKTVEELSNSKTSLPPQTMKKLKIRKRKVMSQIEDEMQKIKALEEDLTVEVERLNQSKRAKQIFCAHLAMERSSPLAVISEEIRTFISPAPVTINATDFTFPLLDGAAEVAMQLSLDDESSKHIELGCFIRDGGASMKLLQAFLLGNIDNHTGNNLGPFPLRSSLSSMIHQNDSREDSFIEASQLFLRIDTLARCVRMLETECFCTIDSYDDKHITLAISIHNEGEIIQIAFSFKDLLANDWNVTTMPSNVDVEIVSKEKDLDFLANQLQEKARNMISTSSPRDPILLRRICDNIMECFSDNR